jgi:AcrR family transcriptional regulator
MADTDATTSRTRILEAAREILAGDSAAPVMTIAAAAGVSRATVHRHFHTRGDLLAALDLEPEPDARVRVLAAAAALLDRDGLAALSMDDLASLAGVSRATVYRLFPGKPALIEALIDAYAPFDPVIARLEEIGDQPPEVVLPDIGRSAATIVSANLGIMRAIFFEVTSGSPDAIEGAGRPIQGFLRVLGGYLSRQMDAGRIRPMHPTLAVQSFVGPLLFHQLTRSPATRYGLLDVPVEDAVEQLVSVSLRGLRPSAPSNGTTDEE